MMFTHSSRNILVVDADVAVRASIRSALSASSFRAWQAQDGLEAAAIADALGGPLHMVITNLRLPDCDGLSLLHRLSQRRPTLRGVLLSDACDDVLCLDPDRLQRVHFVRGPVSVSSLVSRVRDIFGFEPAYARVRSPRLVRKFARRLLEPSPYVVRIGLRVARMRAHWRELQLRSAALSSQHRSICRLIAANLASLKALR